MKKVLQKYGILFFFCAIMGGIIMVDSIFALSLTDRERGLAANFSNSTKKISILQADSQDSFSQADLMYFLQDKRKNKLRKTLCFCLLSCFAETAEWRLDGITI